ncbi:WD40 repeat domain-containing protein [Actinomadura sp. 9N407]|uniref:WD40 repeat domain-containing protein n=1 Tax=Actinomadura sp. 9N407 TaxID=3375154 RepID=UPI00379A2276
MPLVQESQDSDLTADGLGDSVYAFIEQAERDDLLVVAVLGHGLTRGVGDLYVIGADGAHTSRTRVGDWMKEIDHFSGPCTLFLLDLCNAGIAAWPQRQPGQPARSWMLGAAEPDRAAFDGRFTRAVANVLNRIAEGERDIHHSVAHVPLTTIASDVRGELNALVKAEEGYEQNVVGGLVELCDADAPPFFPHPHYRPDPLDSVRRRSDGLARGFLDDLIESINVPGLDPDHFAGRASGRGHTADVALTGCFTGRTEPLADLAAWMDGERDGDLRVVTGSPGVGKSALLGLLVCAAHPALREPTQHLWWSEGRPSPSEHEALAVVHARQRGEADVLAALAGQLSMSPAPADWAAFVQELSTREGEPPLIVVDALDEAVRYDLLTEGLLLIVRTRRADGSPICRLLIGMRPWDRFAGLREAAAAAGGLLDLDERPREETRTDIERYVNALLSLDETYRSRARLGARTAFARAVATALTAEPAGSGERDHWGAFLVAGLYTNLLTRRPIDDPDRAAEFGGSVPRTLPGVLRIELSDRPRLRSVLTALSYAEGDGMPLDLVERILPLFEEDGGTDVRDAFHEARFYLRQTVDVDGTTLYRLYHQSLTDALRDERLEGEVFERVHTGDWRLATPYATRHAAGHAAAADRLDELLTDPEFLAHADPAVLLPHLTGAAGAEARRLAAIYRTSFPRHRRLGPDERRQVLAVDAARHGVPYAANGFARGMRLRPVMATGSQVSPALLASVRPDGGAVVSVVPSSGERPTVIVATEDGPPREWDLRLGAPLRPALGSAPAGAMAVTSLNDRRVLVAGGRDGTVTVWDLSDARPAGPRWTGHTACVTAVECIGPPERRIAVTGGADGTVRRWDLAAMAPFGRPALVAGNSPVTALLATRHAGHDALGVATEDGWLSLWTPGHRPLPDEAADLIGGSLTPSVGQVVATIHLADSPAHALWQGPSGSILVQRRNGELHAWDPVTGETAQTPSESGMAFPWSLPRLLPADAQPTTYAFALGHEPAMGIVGTAGGPVMLARADGAAHPRREHYAGHGGAVTASAFLNWESHPVAVTGGDDGLRVWLPGAGPENPPVSDGAPVTTVVPASPDTGTGAFAALNGQGRLTIWHADRTATLLSDILFAPSALASGFLQGRPVLLASGPEGDVFAVDAADGRVRRRIPGSSGPVSALCWARMDGRDVTVVADRRGVIRIADLQDERPLLSFATGHGEPRDLRMLPGMGGRTAMVMLTADGGCRLWDLARTDLPSISVGHGPEHERASVLACVRMDRRPRLVTGGAEGMLRVWDPQTGLQAGDPMRAHSAPVTALDCLTVGDLTLAVSAGRDARLTVTDLDAGQRVHTFATPESVQALAAGPGTVFMGMGQEVIRMALNEGRPIPSNGNASHDTGAGSED